MDKGTEKTFVKKDTQTNRVYENVLNILIITEMQIKVTVRYCLTSLEQL